jgi:hypothetical protein
MRLRPVSIHRVIWRRSCHDQRYRMHRAILRIYLTIKIDNLFRHTSRRIVTCLSIDEWIVYVDYARITRFNDDNINIARVYQRTDMDFLLK